MPKKKPLTDPLEARTTANRIKTKLRLALHLTQQGRIHDPETRERQVEADVKMLESVIKEQDAKGKELFERLQSIGTEPLAKERVALEKALAELERDFNFELKAISESLKDSNIPLIIQQEKDRKVRQKRTKVVKKSIGPTA